MKCNCDGWVENIPFVDGLFDMAAIHGMKYEGKIFVYCPWCSHLLIPEGTTIRKADALQRKSDVQ